MSQTVSSIQRIDYGIDAPRPLRNLCLAAVACLLVSAFAPRVIHFGADNTFDIHKTALITGVVLTVECALWFLYVRYGKFKHRDMMLALHTWRGDEQVLDVGCGRGLLLIGAAKRLSTGHATGIDIWSNNDLSDNAEANTQENLRMEGVGDRCTLVSVAAQSMPYLQEFDVILSNLCIHNISSAQERYKAIERIAYALRPGGIALISDFKHTREYKNHFHEFGLQVTSKRGSFLTTFPPLNVVIARKPE